MGGPPDDIKNTYDRLGIPEAEKQRLAEVAALVEKLEEIELNVTMKSDPNGNLYGSVNSAKIVELAAEQGATFTEKDVRLDAPIKVVGLHLIRVDVGDDDFGTVKLNVIAEGRTKAEEAAIAAAEAAAGAEAEAESGHSRD